jgi:hypothetical protein
MTAGLAEPPLLQAQVKGLLVVQLPDGSMAGRASQMNATVVPAENKETFGVRFNQQVGKMMEAATVEVEKLMRVRHAGKLPDGHVIEFAFSDKHSPKDGPSAALPCALLAESIITGAPLDPGFAVTGDITATGDVRPIGGVDAKLRGASRKDCSIIAVPKANKASIDDVYVMEGIGPVAETQIILIENFDQAMLVAKVTKPAEIQTALDDFKQVQKAVANNPANSSHPKVVEKLKGILKTLPNHESARLIALHGGNRGPKKLSLVGSLNAIQNGANQLAATLSDGSFTNRGMDDPLWNNVSRLNTLRDAVDPRTRDYLDAFLTTATFFKENRERKYMSVTMQKELQSALEKIKNEEKKLRNSREIQEEMMED